MSSAFVSYCRILIRPLKYLAIPSSLVLLWISCQNTELYDNFHICCERHTWWQDDCSAYDENGNGGSPKHSNQYFADFDSGSCLKDCEPGPLGCASVPPPIALYETIEACCAMTQNWVDTKYCLSRSNGTYSDGWVVSYDDEKCGESVAVVCDSHY